ncbi:MAG: hypothetical protein HYR51_04640 [Candidatus Rokubacteria bacterium]|nr:hypothetical protein [Candidatus Rokubacteria bacterium]
MTWKAEDLGAQPVAYPESAPKLTPGVRYRWELKTADALPERAQFEIIPEQEWKRISAQLQEIKPTDTTSTLARVKILFDERLYQSAREELEVAIAKDKSEPNLVYMLGHVFDRMGLREQAAAAFDVAQKLSTD